MTNNTIWTSALTEQQVKEAWEKLRKKCPWANLGTYEENKEEAWDRANEENFENLLFLSEEFDSLYFEVGDTIALVKNDEYEPAFILDVDEWEGEEDSTLVSCVSYAQTQGKKVLLKKKGSTLYMEVEWVDWLTKEQGTDIYNIFVNGQGFNTFW